MMVPQKESFVSRICRYNIFWGYPHDLGNLHIASNAKVGCHGYPVVINLARSGDGLPGLVNVYRKLWKIT